MKLYYIPGACSLSPNIVLREAGLSFEIEKVDPATGLTETGAVYKEVNPKGKVPALVLDSGDILTEGAAIVQYIADQHPSAGLAPRPGSLERARVQEHLNFIAAELHKAFGPFFSSTATDEDKSAATPIVESRLDHVESVLSDGRAFLNGDDFSVADAYLFVVSSWAKPVGFDISKWPRLSAFLERVSSRPTVQEAMAAEGLV